MMNHLFTAILALSLFSCNQPTGIKEAIVNADSVAINFFKGDGTAEVVTNMVMLKDKGQMSQLAGFVESGKAAQYQCGFDGSIHIFKRDVALQDIDFSMNNAQCMHFSFLLNNTIFRTKLSTEALQFIKSLNKK
jgi:hypothetical protein